MDSGQGKWQEWMPKLERSQLDLGKPCYPQCAGIPVSEEPGSRSHPDNVWFKRDGRFFVAVYPKLQNHKALGGKTGRESIDHSQGCLLSNMLPGRSPSAVIEINTPSSLNVVSYIYTDSK